MPEAAADFLNGHHSYETGALNSVSAMSFPGRARERGCQAGHCSNESGSDSDGFCGWLNQFTVN
jgi:hypothetical protein